MEVSPARGKPQGAVHNGLRLPVEKALEEADDQDTSEVHTREVAEDDVPDEYLEKD